MPKLAPRPLSSYIAPKSPKRNHKNAISSGLDSSKTIIEEKNRSVDVQRVYNEDEKKSKSERIKKSNVRSIKLKYMRCKKRARKEFLSKETEFFQYDLESELDCPFYSPQLHKAARYVPLPRRSHTPRSSNRARAYGRHHRR